MAESVNEEKVSTAENVEVEEEKKPEGEVSSQKTVHEETEEEEREERQSAYDKIKADMLRYKKEKRELAQKLAELEKQLAEREKQISELQKSFKIEKVRSFAVLEGLVDPEDANIEKLADSIEQLNPETIKQKIDEFKTVKPYLFRKPVRYYEGPISPTSPSEPVTYEEIIKSPSKYADWINANPQTFEKLKQEYLQKIFKK